MQQVASVSTQTSTSGAAQIEAGGGPREPPAEARPDGARVVGQTNEAAPCRAVGKATPATTASEDQENLFSSSGSVESVASGSGSESLDSQSSCSSQSEPDEARRPQRAAASERDDAEQQAAPSVPPSASPATQPATQPATAGEQRLQLAVSLENVSDQQEVLKDPSKRITSDNKQREQDLVAQYEKLNISARNSTSSIENEEPAPLQQQPQQQSGQPPA